MTRARRAVLFGVLFAWFGYSGAVYLAAHPDVLPPAGADLLAGFQVTVPAHASRCVLDSQGPVDDRSITVACQRPEAGRPS